ncbi:ricin-type beta-trefoil lectin domain protein [Streptomyces sp. NPDC086787]|uniref:ricin-type beta-trefoil lectin domain protein n=1 Tax=Streptomyces sp. NPDC086787 TaxID=3365759 RepID=UPI003807C395
MTSSPGDQQPEASADALEPTGAGLPTRLPRRTPGPSAITEAGRATRDPVASRPGSPVTSRAPDEPEAVPPMSAAAADFVALTTEPPRPPEPSGPGFPAPTGEPVRPPRRGPSDRARWVAAGTVVALLTGGTLLVLGTGGTHYSTPDTRTAAGTPGMTDSAPPSPETSAPASATPSASATPTVTRPASGPPAPSASARGAATGPGDHRASPSASPAKPVAAVTGTLIRGAGSGRCIEAAGSGEAARTPLRLGNCDNSAAQKWAPGEGGSLRALGKCMAVEGGSSQDGAAIVLVGCDGGGAQRFRLNAAHDLVSTQADKCVDVKDVGTANGTPLQLWTCTGGDNQKWSGG